MDELNRNLKIEMAMEAGEWSTAEKLMTDEVEEKLRQGNHREVAATIALNYIGMKRVLANQHALLTVFETLQESIDSME